MFGMGFIEILLIAIVAIVALGPDKLPGAMVEVAKFLKKFKSGVEDAKSTLDNELNITEMKAEASKFKAQIEGAKSSMSLDNLDLGMDDILNDDLNDDKKAKLKEEKNALREEKKKKKLKAQEKEISKESKVASSDKFKVKKEKDVKEEDN